MMENLTENMNESEIKVQSVVLTGKGSFNYVQVIEWPLKTKLNRDEIKVAVEYCGVNFADVYHVHGQLLPTPAPYVLGLECAGKVIEVGSGVIDLQIGDRVVCYKPETGLFRETVIVPRHQCFAIPSDISNKIACSLIANYLTAYFAMFELGNLRSGQTLLIHSAAGGVGWAATQLACNVVRNVRILGTASENKHTAITENGVSKPLTYENFAEHFKAPVIDIVIDNIGGESLKKSISLLKPLGRVIITGANCVIQEDEDQSLQALQSLAESTVPTHDLVMGNKAVCGLHVGTLLENLPHTVLAAVSHIFTLYQQGLIDPRVHTVLPFNKAVEAIKTLAERKNIGKVLLKV